MGCCRFCAAGVRLDLDVPTWVDQLLGSFVQTDPRLVQLSWLLPQPAPRHTNGRRNGSTAIASARASAGLSRTASAR